MTVQPPRGTRDFLPREMIRREYMLTLIKTVFERYGFLPLETPAFESWELLSKKGVGGEDIRKEIYYFKDKGNRELGLRFDLTAPIARVVAMNPQLQKPFKRYQVGRVWRYDRPQTGRWREFWQADADIVGSSDMACETECLAAAATCLKALGFRDFRIRLNNRKILNGMLEKLNIPSSKSVRVFRALDKLEKFGEKTFKEELRKILPGYRKSGLLLDMIGEKGRGEDFIKEKMNKLGSYTKIEEGLKELQQILRKARVYGVAKWIEIDFSLVRGLDYYTGPIFEIEMESDKGMGSLGGGGRYDNLIELYGGRWTPAVGISLGIERIYEIMDSEKMFPDASTTTRVFVVSVDEKSRKDALKIAQKLRINNINVETDLMGRDMKKQLEYVDKAGIPFAIIVGPKEIRSGRFIVKDMKKRKQARASLERIVKVMGGG